MFELVVFQFWKHSELMQMEMENRLNIFDKIVLGFYDLLNLTLYRSKTNSVGFGAKEHAVLFSWFAYSLNIFVLFKLINPDFLKYSNWYIAFIVFITIVLVVNVYLFLTKKRLKRMIDFGRKNVFAIYTFLYFILSVVLFFLIR